MRAARHHQRRAARRHEGRRRAVRLRPDAAAVRAAVGRDDEGVGRLPRAAHGEGRRRRRQGPHRAGHGQGRRARHRQEPRRHHPHQQRLRGAQPRHQGVDRRDDRQGARGEGRRHRHERPAGEVHADHARQPRGAERPRAGRHPGAARRRRAHPHLRRARPARGLRGPALLRQGRLRGPARDGPPRRAARAARRSTTPTGAGAVRLEVRAPRLHTSGRRSTTSTAARRSPEVETDNPVFVPPFLGSKIVKGIALDDIAAYINETALFRNQWQFRPEAGRDRRDRRRVQGPASARSCASSWPRPAARACWCRPRSTATSPPTATATTS